ncbi:CHAD domain-containing protein [Cyanobium sp. CH-040]|uniref:CHAD domain-containing protein n=1 Tax=Cyanobium sp. CH-040 TaxID=2823708 RepID=UPI0020CD57A1|nr:CHAD domain-containing protein [Cyanobium sp. CH-040]MCP9929150.1 CHAD domain-containing protein [Cyanobium sp. CH-040]
MPARNGDHAHGLLAGHCRRLVELHGPVLESREPQALAEAQLTLSRLRTTLQQFEPALALPAVVSAKRLGKTERRLALAWELERLQQRLESGFLSQVPEREGRRLRPALRQLRRERQLAQQHLAAALNSSGHLQLIAQLQGWLRQPQYTALGEQPLAAWLAEWNAGSAPLLLHRGWWTVERDSDLTMLRDLGEEVAATRLRIANLPPGGQPPWSHGRRGAWLDQLRRAEDLLSELHDLELLRRAIDGQLRDGIERTVPQLEWLLEQHQQQCWRQWGDVAQAVLAARAQATPRGRIRALLLRLAARLE